MRRRRLRQLVRAAMLAGDLVAQHVLFQRKSVAVDAHGIAKPLVVAMFQEERPFLEL